MPPTASQPPNDDIKRWYESTVAPAMREIADNPPDYMPKHCSLETGIKDIYAVRHVLHLADEEVRYTDGGNDGGVDIFYEDRETETGAPVFNLFQVHAPALDKMEQGVLSGRPVAAKFRDDANEVLNTLFDRRPRRLNETAEEVFRRIQDELQTLRDEPTAPTIRIIIRAISLQRVEPEALDALQSLRDSLPSRIAPDLSGRLRLDIADPYTPAELIGRELRKAQEPRDIAFEIEGSLSSASPDRGPFLAFVKARSVVDAYDKYRDNLLDSNLRHWLKERTSVNQDIRRELASVRGLRNFHLKNNGLVVWCRNCRYVQKNNIIHLSFPQIVNGGQTVVTMFHTFQELGSHPDSADWRKHFNEHLLVPAKILKEIPQVDVDAVAIASNSQNPLSSRTLHSARPVMRTLTKRIAAVEPAWFFETKDGEWDALRGERNERLLQSKTGRRAVAFKDGRTTRKVSNEDVGIALLAFYGFPRSAKKTILWSETGFDYAFMKSIRDERWAALAAGAKWADQDHRALLEPVPPGAHQCVLAYLIWAFWRTNTHPETRYLRLAYEDRGRKDSEFRTKFFDTKKGWLVESIPDDEVARTKEQSEVYWSERVAKSAYLVLVFQCMRVLQRRYGPLTDETCKAILRLRELSDMARSNNVALNFRETSITGGPVSLIAKCLLLACKHLHAEHSQKIEGLLSPQQDLLRDEWILRITDAVDGVFERIPNETYRISTKLDPDGEIAGKRDLNALLPTLEAAGSG